jgi:hypothetical protein
MRLFVPSLAFQRAHVRSWAVPRLPTYRLGSDEQMHSDVPDEIAALEAWLAQVEAAIGDGQARETVDHSHEQSHGA